MCATFNSALAPGTYVNRYKQASTFVRFSLEYDVPYLTPDTTQICMFAQYLANRYPSISTVKNYISGAKNWVLEHNGDITSFFSHELQVMLKSISKKSTHVVKRATPLSVEDIILICHFIDAHSHIPQAVKPCILIGYSCYLRSSNLLAPFGADWAGPHTLLRRHVQEINGGLKITILSTKTRATPYSQFVPTNNSARLCPVLAWNKYVREVDPNPNGPAFVVNNVQTLPPILVVDTMRQALQSSPNVDVENISVHSLRRGAVQSAESSGCKLQDIMKRGAWASKAGIKPYRTN